MFRFVGALSVIISTLVLTSSANAQCFSRRSSHGTCSQTLESCSRATGNTTMAGCRRAHAECMKTGRWVYREKDGRCFDWGARRKQ